MTIYWQCRTFAHERSFSEAVHCVALRYSVYRYHVITGWMSSFTFYLINPEISTRIKRSHYFWNTWVSTPAMRLCTVGLSRDLFSSLVWLLSRLMFSSGSMASLNDWESWPCKWWLKAWLRRSGISKKRGFAHTMLK